jgi:hypothetical protein
VTVIGMFSFHCVIRISSDMAPSVILGFMDV